MDPRDEVSAGFDELIATCEKAKAAWLEQDYVTTAALLAQVGNAIDVVGPVISGMAMVFQPEKCQEFVNTRLFGPNHQN